MPSRFVGSGAFGFFFAYLVLGCFFTGPGTTGFGGGATLACTLASE